MGFRRKWEISLAQIDAALRWGVRKHVVLADAGYGDASEFRNGLLSRGLDYLVGVSGTAVVWPPGSNPLIPPQEAGTRGRPRTRYFDLKNPPVAMTVVARDLSYRTVKWRSGSRGIQSSRFAAVRIKTAHKHINGVPPSELQWLICEWPKNEAAPTKFYLSSLPPRTSLKALVRFAKLRWRIERDYQELKQELGLDHFEGRSWRGFHHHATLCSVAHGFLALRRALFPPERHQMDPADGSASPPVRPALAAGELPALPADLHSWRAAARPLAAMKEAIE
jgi:SRSO17 transposase